MAVGKDGCPLSKAGIRGAIERFDAIAGGEAGGAGGRRQIATLNFAGIGVEAEGYIDTLIPVNARVPKVDDSRDPVAKAGDDPESEQETQQVGRCGFLPISTFHPWGHGIR